MKRIKTLSLLIYILLISTYIYSQKKKGVAFNVGTGINYSTIYNDAGDTYPNTRKSFQLGLTLEYYFNDRWSIKSGGIYDSKGVDRLKLNYLFIPLNASWHFGSNRNWYLNFGPYIDLFLSSNPETTLPLKSTDFGVSTGIGYKLKLSNTIKLYFESQHAIGFSDIIPDFVTHIEGLRNIRNSLNIGISFDLK